MTAPVLSVLLRIVIWLCLSSILLGVPAAWVDCPTVVAAAMGVGIAGLGLLAVVAVVCGWSAVKRDRGAGR